MAEKAPNLGDIHDERGRKIAAFDRALMETEMQAHLLQGTEKELADVESSYQRQCAEIARALSNNKAEKELHAKIVHDFTERMKELTSKAKTDEEKKILAVLIVKMTKDFTQK